MRNLRPEAGNNVAALKKYYGRWASNGAASPTAWVQGGKGMGVPVRTAVGTFTCAITDPPGGVLVGWKFVFRCNVANIANFVDSNVCDWNATTNVVTLATRTVGTATLADPPAAAAGYEFTLLLAFSQSENL